MSVEIVGAHIPPNDDGLEILAQWAQWGGQQGGQRHGQGDGQRHGQRHGQWGGQRGGHGAPVRVPIGAVRISDSPRLSGENLAHLRALAEVDGPLPPIVVHRQTMRVVDGVHRLLAARSRGEDHIEVRFFDGEPDDAFVLAVTLNTSHGLPLTRAERSAAVLRIMRTRPQWSDRAIAMVTGLSDKTVAGIRRSSAEIPPSNTRIGRDGRARPRDGAEGRLRASHLIAAKPDASLREIAARAGIAVATARDVRRRMARGEDPLPPRQRAAVPRPRPAEPRLAPERAGGPSKAATTGDRALGVIMRSLRNDPSLRFSEAGRTLLRLLDIHAVTAESWDRLVDAVPAHCAPSVVRAAQECAAAWQRFAEQLERRGDTTA